MTVRSRILLFSAMVFALAASAGAQVDPALYSDMRWREIGPLRAGRTRALAGVSSQPATFYLGAVGGGVWKTTDAGATWFSIWNSQPTGSIGSIAVSESDPNVVYVGSGEGQQRPDLSTGDGVYKSTDAGKTWVHLADLRDTQQIGQVAVDPTNPDKVFVAAEGHPYGPSEQRGLYLSTDGGKTFRRVINGSKLTGASEVQIDPHHPNIVYAGLWQRQEAPWENGSFGGSEGGLYKSSDGGETWTKLTGNGLPDNILQLQLSISPADSDRIYAEISTTDRRVGFYRSDDAGKTWAHVSTDTRPEGRIGGGDVPVPKADPRERDTVYVASIVSWKSTDGGKTWTALRGAPGGDDYQNVWVNPNNNQVIALASDQGAVVSENGGQSWTQWYNQATAAVYHVTADNAFPYRVCGGQQDSGSACVSSRSNDGVITFHDWHPAGIEEYGYAAPDPLDPEIVYGGKVTRYDRRTGQIQHVEPDAQRGSYRTVRTEPLQFSPVDSHKLYFASNFLWLTEDGGKNWKKVSPDLSRETWESPAVVDDYKNSPDAQPSRRGVIYSIGLSPLDGNRIWAGTDDGLIWTTTDGGANWQNVTPPALKPFWKVFNIDPGHFDTGTLYAAVNTLRLDDMRPHLFRTRDSGKTWTEIDNGIPAGAATSTIREDPKKKGLLYAGTETQVYVSFDDGDHWQSLRLNLPASSVRDLQIKDDDLIAGTHGRGFLILDDLTPLRQIAAGLADKKAYLYAPQTALRIRNNMNPPTPWPPDMATGENPPPGAVIDYYLGPKFSGAVTLEILDSKGQVVSHYSSTDPVDEIDPLHYSVPVYWARPPQVLSAAPGHHRFLWDVQYAQIPGVSTEPSADEAVPFNTPNASTAPWVLPGSYSVRLTAGGESFIQPLKVVIDPRVKTPPADLETQFTLARSLYDDAVKATQAIEQIAALRKQLRERQGQAPVAASGPSLESRLDAIAGRAERGGRGGGGGGGRGGLGSDPTTLSSVRMSLLGSEREIEAADCAPTTTQVQAAQSAGKPLADLLQQWEQVKRNDLKSLNEQLKQSHLALLDLDVRRIDEDEVEGLVMGGDDDQ
jgi:photosystem II stability/assembly factor-like uncharacterized protein